MSKAIEVNNIEFAYLGSNDKSLSIHEFSVEEGESVLITGLSGSGKSTFIQCINGIIPHIIDGTFDGSVKIFGNDTKEMKVPEISRTVGTLLQDPERQVINYTVEEEVAFAPENFNIPAAEIKEMVNNAISSVGIDHLKGKETLKLSGGELQRVALASVLTMDPRILILDEPTSNIDPEGTNQIFEFLRKEVGKRTLLVVEHKVERVLPFIDRVVVFDQGRIVIDDKKENILNDVSLLEKLGIEIPENMFLARKMGLKSYDIETVSQYISENRIALKMPERKIGDKLSLRTSGNVKYDTGFDLNFNLEFKSGTITAIVGKNGSGKSTLFKGLIGWLDDMHQAVSDVKIETPEKVIKDNNIAERGKIIGYLPQSFDLMLINRTVKRELHYSRRVRGNSNSDSDIERITKLFTLEKYMDTDPLMLSQGQRRRVAMAATIAGGPKIILMDEPTSGQDYYHKKNLGDEIGLLKQMGYTIIMVSHDMRFAFHYADRMVVLDNGKIVADGTPEEVFDSSEIYGLLPPAEFSLRRGIIV